MLPETGGLNRFNDELQREYHPATHRRFPLGHGSSLYAYQASDGPSRAFLAQASESSQYMGRQRICGLLSLANFTLPVAAGERIPTTDPWRRRERRTNIIGLAFGRAPLSRRTRFSV